MALITITGNLKDLSGAAVNSGLVVVSLVNYGGNLPYVSGTGIIVPLMTTFTAA